MFLYIHLTHWLWFNMHIYSLTFWFGSKIIYLLSNLISKIFSKCLRIVCELCSLLPPLSNSACMCMYVSLCMPHFLCVFVSRQRTKRASTNCHLSICAIWWDKLVWNVHMYFFSTMLFFFCKCCMIFLLWTIFLTYFDPLRIWRTGTIPNQGTYQMHKICFVL